MTSKGSTFRTCTSTTQPSSTSSVSPISVNSDSCFVLGHFAHNPNCSK